MPRLSLPTPLVCLLSLLGVQGLAAEDATVSFARRHAAVGDQSEQTVAVRFSLTTTMRSGQKVLREAETAMSRDQRRVITTTSVGPHGAQAATVAYLRASRRAGADEPAPEPVAGKRYHCQRQGERLLVTDPAGRVPPLDEYTIVAANMETLGRENPLAAFLAGRTLVVGQRLELPREVAARLLGFEEQLASAKRFSFRLTGAKQIGGRRCAVFQTEIEARSGATGQMGLVVAGPMVVEADGCRVVSADLTGPIGVSETRAASTGAVQVTGAGKLQIALSSRYRSVE